MNRFFKIQNKRIALTHLTSIILIVLSAVFFTLVAIYIAPESFMAFVGLIKQHPSLFVLNLLPVLITALLIWFISGNTVISVTLTGALYIIFAVANTIKISMRQSPVLPTDLTLIVEALAIVKNFNTGDIALSVFLIAAVIVFAAVVLIFIKNEKISLKKRLISIVITVAAAFLLNTLVYSSTALYNSFPVNGNIYFAVNQYGSKGLIYSFFHNINTLNVERPEDYDEYSFPTETVYKYDENAENKPNIIMIMGEAFSDLSENENISFEGYTDPLESFKALSSEEGSLSGHIIVPNFGGGTSDTEFDVLTGYPTRYLGNTLSSYSFVNKKTDSLPWVFKNMGYDTLAVHPGYSWFYDRLNVYNHFGFDKFLYLENDFDATTQNKGGYIAEEHCMDKIIEQIDNKDDENPLFLFCVTIQNHGPYDEKYNEAYDNFSTDVALTDLENTLLNSYFEGIKDADKELKRLTDYLSAQDEPYVVVYFGDHLPGFSNGTEFFDILDYDINTNGDTAQRLAVYKTPFLIWQNDAAKEENVLNEKDLVMPENRTINSNYLGALLLDCMGYGDATEYISYINELRKTLPICANSSFMDINGNYYDSLDEDLSKKVSYLRSYVYYEMFDK